MDLRLLEIFCRVYDERSFSAAARELRLTQPTVSTHIRELEESLGTPLFNRLGREIQPTEAGRQLHEHAKEIVALKRTAVEKMAQFLGRVEGVLTVGASSVPGECLLPALLTEFHARHAAVQTRLRIGDSSETIEDVRHGHVELGVVGTTTPDPDLLFEPFASDSLVLAVPNTAEWRRRPRLNLRELREIPMVVREVGSGTRTALETALATKHTSIREMTVVAELGSLGAIKEAVKRGCGVSFVSELAIESERKTGVLKVAGVAGLGTIRRTYSIVSSRRRALAPLSRTFLEYLREVSASRRQAAARSSSKPRG